MVARFLTMIKYISIFILALYSTIWLISPSATRFYSDDFLQLLSQNHLALSEKSTIRYNPFLSHLSIYDFSLIKKNHNQEVVLSIDELHLEIGLYKLLVNQLQISEFSIKGLFVKIDINQETIEVAGISLADSSATEVEQEIIEEVEEDASELLVKMDQFNLSDAKIQINVNEHPHLLNIEDLTIERVNASSKIQQVALLLKGSFNEAPLSVNVNAQLQNGKGNIASYVSLSQLELQHFNQFIPKDIHSLSGKINISSEQQISLSAERLLIDVKQLNVQIQHLILEQEAIILSIENQKLSHNTLTIEVIDEQAPKIQGSAEFLMNGLHLSSQNQNQNQILAALAKLNVSKIDYQFDEQVPNVDISAIELSQFYASDDISNNIPPLAGFSSLNIQQINATDKSLAINNISLSGLNIDVQLDENKNMSNLVALPVTSPPENQNSPIPKIVTKETKAIENTENKEPPATFSLSLQQFSLTDDAHINFIDHSIKPTFERHVIISELMAGPINNETPDLKTLYNVIGNSEAYAHFNFSGFAQPFLKQPIYHLKGNFKELSLPAVSTYMKEALQYVFDSGQLDLAVDTTLTGSTIEGNMLMVMRGIELTAAEDDEVNSLSDHSAIPFSVALGMLKDNDGNVELDIPLSGDSSSPSFGMSGFVTLLVKQATMMAAKDYLMTTFVPYANVISIAMTAGDYLLKIRFNDLEFPATQTELQPEHQEFLTQFSALLKEKEGENITLCAIATAQDIGKAAGTKVTDKEAIKKLKKISLARMHAFKGYMVKEEKISSSRLLLCTPQVDFDIEAKPRITFTN